MSEVESIGSLATTMERLSAAAGVLEQAVAKLEERQSAISGEVRKIVATVEQSNETGSGDAQMRIAQLEERLRYAEQQLAEVRASAGKTTVTAPAGRKTVPAATATLLAKQGIANLESVEAGALDAAMASLSIEQRIAVKSQLLRAGLLR